MSEQKKDQCYHDLQFDLHRFAESLDQMISLNNQLAQMGMITMGNITDAHILRIIEAMDRPCSDLFCSHLELRYYAQGTGYYDPELPRRDLSKVKKYTQEDLDAAVKAAKGELDV